MDNKFYDLDDIRLIPFSESMIEQLTKSNYYLWFNDQEVTKYSLHGLFPQTKKEIKNFFTQIENNEILCFAIIANNIHIGNVSLQNFSWINRTAEFAIIIGEKEYWKKGIATEVARKIFEHGFMKLNLNKIWLGTAETNIGMKNVAENLGMHCEGNLIEEIYLEGKYINVLRYGILKGEFNDKFKNSKQK